MSKLISIILIKANMYYVVLGDGYGGPVPAGSAPDPGVRGRGQPQAHPRVE